MSHPPYYDVFISCKWEDYELVQPLYNYLNEQGYTVFKADINLDEIGEDQYGPAIRKALEICNNLIVFGSQKQYFEAKWVHYEWNAFLNEKLTGRKTGNIIPVIAGNVDFAELPFALRNLQGVKYSPTNFTRITKYIIISEEKKQSIPEPWVQKIKQSEPLLRVEVDGRSTRYKVKWWHIALLVTILATITYVVWPITNKENDVSKKMYDEKTAVKLNIYAGSIVQSYIAAQRIADSLALEANSPNNLPRKDIQEPKTDNLQDNITLLFDGKRLYDMGEDFYLGLNGKPKDIDMALAYFKQAELKGYQKAKDRISKIKELKR